MSKKSRKNKPERTLFGTLWKTAKLYRDDEAIFTLGATGNKADDPDQFEIIEEFFKRIPHARTIRVDWPQLSIFGAAWARDGIASGEQPRMPFDIVLIEFTDIRWANGEWVGIFVLTVESNENDDPPALIVMPLYHFNGTIGFIGWGAIDLAHSISDGDSVGSATIFQEDLLSPEDIEDAKNDIGIAIGAVGGLSGLLESANVDLVESERQYPRGHVGHGKPRFDIAVRQSTRRYAHGDPEHEANYSHRFEVRGNFAHHFRLTPEGNENRIFAKWSVERPEKVIVRNGEPCVRIWRPPYVKGPSDKPLMPKIRRIV